MPGRAGRWDAGEPEHAERHDGGSNRHEPARPVLRRETAETRREEDEEQRPGDPSEAGAGGRVAERALLKDGQVIKGDVERPVDEERRNVGDGEVARLEEAQ